MNAMGMQMGSTISMGSTGSTETESSLESSCSKDSASTSSSLSTSSCDPASSISIQSNINGPPALPIKIGQSAGPCPVPPPPPPVMNLNSAIAQELQRRAKMVSWWFWIEVCKWKFINFCISFYDIVCFLFYRKVWKLQIPIRRNSRNLADLQNLKCSKLRNKKLHMTRWIRNEIKKLKLKNYSNSTFVNKDYFELKLIMLCSYDFYSR